MPRKLRLEYSGEIRHVMSRGDQRQDIFLDDAERVGHRAEKPSDQTRFGSPFASGEVPFDWTYNQQRKPMGLSPV